MLRLRHYWQHGTAGKVIVIAVLAFLLLLTGGYSQSRYFAWVGVGDFVSPTGEYQRGKTLWDWLELAIVPVVLAGGAFLLNRASRQSELEIAEVQRQNELEIAQDRDEERALQGYLDAMTELLLDRNLRASEPDSEVRSIARSRTLTVLRNLNGRRKGSVVHFLHQAKLANIESVVVYLSGADLTNAFLSLENLQKADLSAAFLSRSDLSGADLGMVDLNRALLQQADLSQGKFGEVRLSKADLHKADLSGADLSRANLCEAFLRAALPA